MSSSGGAPGVYVPPHRRNNRGPSFPRTQSTSTLGGTASSRWPTGKVEERSRKGRGWAAPPLRAGLQERSRKGRGKVERATCTRCMCGPEHPAIYQSRMPVEHVLRLSEARSSGRSLLGTHSQFCAAFYHTFVCYEAGTEAMCLDPETCAIAHAVICVARLLSAETKRELYCARYQNCFRGSTECNYHAEQFMLDDEQLIAAVRGAKGGGVLEVFLTYQPCHFSSGHVKTAGRPATTSCTVRLLHFHDRVLRPCRVDLVVKIAKVYRAHWEDSAFHASTEDAAHYGERAGSAREGLRMLMVSQPGVDLRLFEPEDWLYIASLAEPYVGEAARAAHEREYSASGNVKSPSAVGQDSSRVDDDTAAVSEADLLFTKLSIKETLKSKRPERPGGSHGCRGGPLPTSVQTCVTARAPPPLFTRAHLELRQRNDAFYKNFLQKLRMGKG